jgi:hypothetical protein
LCIFRPEPKNLQCQNLPMPHPLVWPLLSLFWGWTLAFIF